MRSPRVLITAGPTHEPLDQVRYLANRSSGRVGIEIAEAALDAGWKVTLALGPTHLQPRTIPPAAESATLDQGTHERASRFQLLRFRTTADLERCLMRHEAENDVLIMAAAVADFRPVASERPASSKLRRTEHGLTLSLESTPDLIADCVARRQTTQSGTPSLIVAFALEPADGLVEAARAKMIRKRADLIVANPLETMDAPTISADLVSRAGVVASTGHGISKAEFGNWLIGELARYMTAEPNG